MVGRAERANRSDLRLLVLAETLGGTGGIQRSTLEVSRMLHTFGAQVYLAFGKPGELITEWRSFRADEIELGSTLLPRRRPVRSLIRRRDTRRFAIEHKIQVVYTHSPRQIELGYRTARSAGAAYVHHARTSPPANSTLRAMTRDAEALVSVSQSTLNDWVQQDATPPRTVVVPNGVDLAVFRDTIDSDRSKIRETYGLDADTFLIGYFGRVSRRKGVQDLLDAFTRVRAARSGDVQLIVVGTLDSSPQSRAPTQQVVGLDSAGVAWVGHVDNVSPLMAACDVVAVPSHYETFGRVAVEALACGTPVVASRVGGLPEIFRGPLDQYLFERANVSDLTRALIDVIDCPPDGQNLRSYARQFSLEITAAEVMKALTSARDARSMRP